jgi:hypothetical protein
MSPSSPPINPSHAVERIREIIVGRHLEKLESRVASLETGIPPGKSTAPWEDRLITHEARLEALQDALQRLTSTSREEAEIRSEQQREEIQRLASQIHQVAALRAAEAAAPAVQQLEQKLGTWLNNWQGALQTHLTDREHRITTQIRDEVASLWESTESQITRLQSRCADREMIDARFQKIAEAARALADCAYPSTSGTESPSR